MFDLQGRRVLVTGGTSGIGLAIARAFLKAGARAVVTGRSAETGETAEAALAEHGVVRFMQGDVASEADCARVTEGAAEAMGGIDVLVCAAGLNRRMRPETVTLADWDAVVDASLKGTFLMARACYPHLARGGDGRIVTLGSMMSVLANDMTAPYAAAKGGVVQLTRSLAVAWAGEGIKANCILPGWIDTRLTRQARRDMPDLDARVRARTPAGDWGRPEDVAGTALFLATPAARFVTGAAIPVDGGYLIRG
ncbi:SDR family NAD(P)-dependent oxidoreductase [Rhodovulum euryhalinum]|uniref:2-deoxy-D-gluconate 3-dehydrogenase n=1 Tax=Rhodovulum euryhalinum TaxID=35805 RepID=A0A4R2KVD1_9RHOB|nr:SDR family NAD(P)-dependent oxidoreductase [Rhodovulum euryhalinum]TCO74178.1 2-deoxy-D-gluconate 3-dehydrogenase [Rhodovulum euryhalinum]